MKRNSLAFLIEGEFDQMTVLMAASGITDKLQQIAEQLAKMVANDVMPLGDSMRDIFGGDKAESFEKAVSDKITALVDQVRDAKNTISDHVESLKNGDNLSDLSSSDDIFGDDDSAALAASDTPDDLGDLGDMGDAAGDAELDNSMGDMSDDDMFGDSKPMGPAGRPQKESLTPTGKALTESYWASLTYPLAKKLFSSGKTSPEDIKVAAKEMLETERGKSNPKAIASVVKDIRHQLVLLNKKDIAESTSGDLKLVREFSRYLREGKTATDAAKLISETYAINLDTVVDIISKVKKA